MSSAPHVSDALRMSSDARIMMRWWWFGPSISCQEITRQLTLMQDAGIGGVEVAYIYPVCVDGTLDGISNERFLSPAFCRILRFAAEEAERLGLRFDLTLGSGWPFGGPHISPRHAAQQLKTQVIDIPAQAAVVPLPPLGEHERIVAAVCEDGRAITVDPNQLCMSTPAADVSQAILLIAGPTGQTVKRAALGAEGLVLDHYREAALKVHLDAVGSVLLDAIGRGRVRAVFTDSLEVYGSNWSDGVLAEFKQRRGYELAEFLPMLIRQLHQGDEVPPGHANATQSSQFLRDVQHDYAQTLTELLHDQFLHPLQQFAHRHGVLSRVQAYGVPPATLSSYRHVDLPEGETTLGSSEIQQPAEWTEITPNRIAASAGRSKSHNIVSAETWTRLHSPPYAATPLDMKAEADQFFLQGVNQIMGHGWCHRPAEGDPTRWVFYAAGNFNEVNPWHPVLGDLAHYLQTVSSVLRSGESVVDAAIYLPDHDVWAGRTLSPEKANLHHVNAMREHIGLALPAELLRMGFNFDLVDDDVLQTMATSGTSRYRIVVLPRIERIPLDTLRAVQHLAGREVHIVALERVPNEAPGHIERKRDGEAIKQLAAALFEGNAMPCVHRVAESDISALKQWCVPDVDLNQESPTVGYVHRRLADGDLYFFANTTNRVVRLEPRFRDPRPYVYRLDPICRRACRAKDHRGDLSAYESVLYLLCDQELKEADFADFTLSKPMTMSRVDERDISHGWELTFPDGSRKQLDRVQPWTDWQEYRDYAGSATYGRSFEMPQDWVSRRIVLAFDEPRAIPARRRDPARRNTGYRTFLDTPIRDAAEVFVNGMRIAALFCPPYRVDLTDAIRQGENLLQIRVYNRLINALASGSRYDFADEHRTYGQRFDGIQDFESLTAEPAGLEGTVRLAVHEDCSG